MPRRLFVVILTHTFHVFWYKNIQLTVSNDEDFSVRLIITFITFITIQNYYFLLILLITNLLLLFLCFLFFIFTHFQINLWLIFINLVFYSKRRIEFYSCQTKIIFWVGFYRESLLWFYHNNI